jgi:hypothetical protein
MNFSKFGISEINEEENGKKKYYSQLNLGSNVSSPNFALLFKTSHK